MVVGICSQYSESEGHKQENMSCNLNTSHPLVCVSETAHGACYWEASLRCNSLWCDRHKALFCITVLGATGLILRTMSAVELCREVRTDHTWSSHLFLFSCVSWHCKVLKVCIIALLQPFLKGNRNRAVVLMGTSTILHTKMGWCHQAYVRWGTESAEDISTERQIVNKKKGWLK